MKLLKLHIENFGKFSSFDYSFNRGLNLFCEENGYGKTTLAAFIKAMFYGMPNSDGRSTGFNDRKHYLPFGGGKYGGSLTFELSGTECRIERIFDRSSAARDSVKVYCGGAPYGGFGGDIGMAVFGVDVKAFERTVFIDSSKLEMRASDSISAKLNSIAGGVSSGETITSAVNALNSAAREIKPDRGSGGRINELDRRICAIEREIYDTEQVAGSLAEKYSSYNALQGEIRALEVRSGNARDAAVVNARWKTYDSLIAQEQAARQQYSAIVAAYPRGIPSQDEIRELKNQSVRIDRSRSAMDIKAFGGGQKQRLDSLRAQFASGVPTESVLDDADRKAVRCSMLEQEIDGLAASQPDARQESLERRFAGGVPAESVVEACGQKIDALRDTDTRITARMTAGNVQPQTQPQRAKKGGKWHILLAVIAVLMLIGGVSLMLVNTLAGGVLAIAGAILLIVAVILIFKNRGAAAGAPAVNIDDTLADLQYSKNKLTEELRALLAPYGYYSASVESDFAAFKNDVLAFKQLKERAALEAQDKGNKRSELGALKAELTRLLATYGLTNDNLQAGVRTLRSLAEEYVRLCGVQSQSEDYMQSAREDMAASCGRVNAILAKYSIALNGDLSAVIDGLEQAERDAARLKGEAEIRHREAESYRAENGLGKRPDSSAAGEDMLGLRQQLAEKNGALAALGHEISLIEDRAEKLDGLKSRLAAVQAELAAAEERYKLLVAARDMIKSAQQNLKDRYVAPVKDKFTYYAGKIEETLGEKVTMDGNFAVSFERGGAIISDDYLSAGQRSICDLCFRLALIDNMYTGGQPFIVMDDPFINLDEGHLRDVLKLVKALAKDRQIIYFCCHASRSA